MELWSENQGQSHLYSNFGSVPGRNCTHNYHDRYQATQYPLHYGELQYHGRESSYLTLGSRTGRAPQKYTNRMVQELTAPVPPPSYPRQDLVEYQAHEARDEEEWTMAPRAVREYESGLLREGWQRRWGASSPDRYTHREVSATSSDGSYRELEAWAARYSHSLPRRRRKEAELRASSQGMLESSRAPERGCRSGADPQVASLRQVVQSANIRDSRLWDRGSGEQALTNYTSQTPFTGTSHMLDGKDKTGYKRRTVSHPPGYIAPPPYNSPHRRSSVSSHSDTSCEKEEKRQTDWSQPTIRKHDVSVEPRKGEKKDSTKPDVTQYTFPKHQRPETDALQASSAVSFQTPHIKHEGVLSLQWPPALQAAQDQKINEEASQKVIEGRKFRLNKKTGGMTIFCLVSRMAGTTGTPSLPLCASETITANTEEGGVSKGLRDSGDVSQTHKLADEVDSRAPTLAEQSDISDVRNLQVTQDDTQTCEERELSNKAEAVIISPGKSSTNDADPGFGRKVSQPLSVKYPLWREPNFASRLETESSSTCLKANNEEGESDALWNEDVSAESHPTDIEVRRLDIKKDTKSEDSEGLLVVDTTCGVVKMELIPSPKKKQVYHFDSTAHTTYSPLRIQSNVSPECVQSNGLMNQDETTDQNAETDLECVNERPETELDLDLARKKATEGERAIPLPWMSSASGSEKETVEEYAEGILGIPPHYCTTEQEPGDARALLDLCVEDQEPSPVEDDGSDDAAGEIPEDKQSQIRVEVDQTEDVVGSHETCNPTGKVTDDRDEARAQKQISTLSEENNVDIKLRAPTPDTSDSPDIEMTEDLNIGSSVEEGRTEQNQEENRTVEKESNAQYPAQCLSSPTTLPNSDSTLPSSTCDAPDSRPPSSDRMSLLYSSESPIERGPNPDFIAHNSTENLSHYPVSLASPQTPSEQTPSPPPPGATDFSQSSPPHEGPSPGPSLPDLINPTAEAASGVKDQDEECETSQLVNNEISDDLDVTEEPVLRQQVESSKPDNAACAKERNVTDEHETKEPIEDATENIMELIPEQPQDDGTKVNILLECVQEEDVACVTQSSTTVEQLPKMKAAISQENSNKSQTEAHILQQLFDKDALCPKEKYTIEGQSQKEASGGKAGLLEETIAREDATDSQTQKEMETMQDIEPAMEPPNSSPPSPSDFACVASRPPLHVLSFSRLPSPSQSSNTSDTEFASLSEMDSLTPVDDDDAPTAAIPETVPSPVHLDSCEESLKSTPSAYSPSVSPSSLTTAVLHEAGGRVSPDSSVEEEPQYPQSLWDAVNRIRKHTAPDSESEEEASDLWDPERGAEDLGRTGVGERMDFEKRASDEAEQRGVSAEGSVDDIAVGIIWQDPRHQEPSGHAEGDSRSCSSASSHGSEDTVIIDDEDEFEEMTPNAGRETKSVHEEKSQSTEGERC